MKKITVGYIFFKDGSKKFLKNEGPVSTVCATLDLAIKAGNITGYVVTEKREEDT